MRGRWGDTLEKAGPGDRSAGRLPNFFVIGAMKAGTSSLYLYLSAHPDVFMPPDVKEPSFFSTHWADGVDRYAGLFRDAGPARAVGEASTNYSKHPKFPEVPERMASLVPDARLVYVLRHPIERMRSQYAWRVLLGWERRPVDVALLEDWRYLSVSQYSMQIERYLEFFPRERMLIITSERLRAARDPTISEVFRFLGVDPAVIVPTVDQEFNRTDARRSGGAVFRTLLRQPLVRSVAGRAPRLKAAAVRILSKPAPVPDTALAPETEERLAEMLRDDVCRVRQYLGDGFDAWGLA
jgi:hypothetical protein